MKSINYAGVIIDQGKFAIRNYNFTERRLYLYIVFSSGRVITKELKPKSQWIPQKIPEGAEIIL